MQLVSANLTLLVLNILVRARRDKCDFDKRLLFLSS